MRINSKSNSNVLFQVFKLKLNSQRNFDKVVKLIFPPKIYIELDKIQEVFDL